MYKTLLSIWPEEVSLLALLFSEMGILNYKMHCCATPLSFSGGVFAMSDHYFSENPTSDKEHREVTGVIRGLEFTFISDAGVFSKTRVDTGTKLLIESVDFQGAKRVLDLGCGYGPIGIVVAKFMPDSTVTMVDVNGRAVELANLNIQLNNILNATVFCGDGFLPIRSEKFDLILTNPPIRAGKAVLYRLIEESVEHLNPGGRFCSVLRTKQGARTYRNQMDTVFANTIELAKGSGYRVFEGHV